MSRAVIGLCLGLIGASVLGTPTSATTAVQQAEPERKVTLDLKDVPLRGAIDALFSGTNLQYSVDPNVPNVPVTLNLRDVGLQAALRLMIRQASATVPGLMVSRGGEVYNIMIRPGTSPSPPFVPTVTIQLKEVPLRSALDALFQGTGLQYSVDPQVQNIPVTLNLRDVRVDEALRILVRQAVVAHPGLVSEYRNDIYYVFVRQPGQGASEPPTLISVPVHFRGAAELARQLRDYQLPAGIEKIDPLIVNNNLVFLAAPSAHQRLQDMVRTLDVPATALSVRVGVTGRSASGGSLQLSSLTRAVAGREIVVNDQAGLEGRVDRMSVRVRPVIQGSGEIQAESDWDVSVAVAGGSRGPIRLVKRLTTVTLLKAGQGVAVAEADLTPHGGKGTVRLWLRVDLANVGASASKPPLKATQ